jgi:hypothetical protein
MVLSASLVRALANNFTRDMETAGAARRRSGQTTRAFDAATLKQAAHDDTAWDKMEAGNRPG